MWTCFIPSVSCRLHHQKRKWSLCRPNRAVLWCVSSDWFLLWTPCWHSLPAPEKNHLLVALYATFACLVLVTNPKSPTPFWSSRRFCPKRKKEWKAAGERFPFWENLREALLHQNVNVYKFVPWLPINDGKIVTAPHRNVYGWQDFVFLFQTRPRSRRARQIGDALFHLTLEVIFCIFMCPFICTGSFRTRNPDKFQQLLIYSLHYWAKCWFNSCHWLALSADRR